MKLALALLLAALAASAQERMNDALRKGIAEEDAGKNWNAAIQQYQSVLAQFDDVRKTAATALFRLAEVYRKTGRTAQAEAAYNRVVREFPDQTALAAESRKRLPQSNTTSADTREARQRYRETLVEKEKLADSYTDMQQRKVELGASGPMDLLQAKMAQVEAQRALAVHDQDRARIRALLLEEIKLATSRVEHQQQNYQLGVANSSDIIAARKALLDLQGELAELDGGKAR